MSATEMNDPIGHASPTAEQAMRAGLAARTFMGDPRVSAKQMKAIAAICETDAGARVLGLDGRNRPVVRARVGIPRQVRTWALLRNGDPADAGEVRERWQERSR